MNPKTRSRYRLLLRACCVALPVSLVFPLAQNAGAADGTWNTTTSGLSWGTPGNWLAGVADGSGFTANFNTLNPTASVIVNLDSPRTIGNLIFGDTDTTSAASWTLGNSNNVANILTLAGTTPTITTNALGTNSLVTISAVIAGTDGLTKNGTGTTTTGILALSGANTYSGGTTISTGSIRALNNTALGTGAVTVSSGARLQLGGGITVANTINLNGSSALYGNTGANTLSGTVNLQSAATVALAASNDNNVTFTGSLNLGSNALTVTTVGNTNAFVSINGAINGTGGLSKTGAGTLILNSDQTSSYSGNVSFTGGVLALGSNGALGTGTFSLGVNDSSLSVRSTSTDSRTVGNALTLLGNANTLYTFGSVTALFNGDLVFSSTGNVAMGSLNRKFVVNNNTQFNGVFTGTAGMTKQTGTGALILTGASTYTGTTTISAGTLQLGNGGITGSLATGSAIVNNANFAIKRSNGVAQGTDFASVISGSGSFTQAGTGTTTLSAGNTYTGNTVINSGTLAMGANNVFAATNFVMGGGTFAVGTFNDSVGTLSLTGNATITLGSGGFFAFADSEALNWGTNTLSITGTFVDGFSIRFGTDATGLSDDQLALIKINGANALIDSSGYLTAAAVPEPSTYAVIAGAALLGFAAMRRRRSAVAA